jgi:DNA adenine methylase
MDSFIGWVGGKKQLRKEIVSKFPPQTPTRYVEVCGGAGWVFFEKEKLANQLEIFNDIDSHLINLYRCIQYHPEALIKELQDILQFRELFYDYREQINTRGLTDIQRAARYFYLIKTSFGSNKNSFATRRKRLDKALEKFDDIQIRLTGVVIENKDFEDLIKLYDSEGTLFYVDPPYYKTERYYNKNGKPFLIEDHYRLKDCLSNIKGKFILSYNDDQFIRTLYNDFNIEGISRNNTLAANSTNSEKFLEVIICNY